MSRKKKTYNLDTTPLHEGKLRDKFAAAALTGLITRGAHDHDKRDGQRYYELAYEIADGMLEARKK